MCGCTRRRPRVVYDGYTPGYVGSYVAPGSTVVYGSGWYYQPWIGTCGTRRQ